MHFLKSLCVVGFILYISLLQITNAQSLNGKVIYISPSQVVMLQFRSVIVNATLADAKAYPSFQTTVINNKNYSIKSTLPNFQTTNLIVLEGDNTHLFVLKYKEALDPKNEIVYDYSSRKKLKEAAEDLDKIAKKEADSVVVIKDVTSPPKVKPVESPKISEQELMLKHSEIVTKAINAQLEKRLNDAKELYREAIKLKPDDDFSVKQIAIIENRLIGNIKEDENKARESAYKNFRNTGDSSLKKKSYQAAIAAYNQALHEKEKDPYVLAQLKLIEQAIKNDSYLSYMNLGKDALTNGFFDDAILDFNEALKLKPKDPEAIKALAKIKALKEQAQKTQATDKSKVEIQNKYDDTLSLADKMYDAGLYEEAIKKYKKADVMKPGIAYHKNRIATIDSILLKQKTDVSRLKKDSLNTVNYNVQLEKGKKALESKDLKKAKEFFQLALKLKPDQTFPALKISEIDLLLVQSDEDKKKDAFDKRRKDSINRQYDFSMKQGAVVLGKNNFNAANILFMKAHELKPDEKAPIDQLQIISKKLQEIRDEERYTNFIHLGDSLAFKANDLTKSLKWYDSARILKPKETFARKQILAVTQKIYIRDSLIMDNEKKKDLTIRYNEGIDSYKMAETARYQRKNEDAYKGYAAFLAKIDVSSFDKYTSAQQYVIKQSRDMLGRLDQFKPDPVEERLRAAHIQDSIKNIKPAKGRKKKA